MNSPLHITLINTAQSAISALLSQHAQLDFNEEDVLGFLGRDKLNILTRKKFFAGILMGIIATFLVSDLTGIEDEVLEGLKSLRNDQIDRSLEGNLTYYANLRESLIKRLEDRHTKPDSDE